MSSTIQMKFVDDGKIEEKKRRFDYFVYARASAQLIRVLFFFSAFVTLRYYYCLFFNGMHVDVRALRHFEKTHFVVSFSNTFVPSTKAICVLILLLHVRNIFTSSLFFCFVFFYALHFYCVCSFPCTMLWRIQILHTNSAH